MCNWLLFGVRVRYCLFCLCKREHNAFRRNSVRFLALSGWWRHMVKVSAILSSVKRKTSSNFSAKSVCDICFQWRNVVRYKIWWIGAAEKYFSHNDGDTICRRWQSTSLWRSGWRSRLERNTSHPDGRGASARPEGQRGEYLHGNLCWVEIEI